METIVNAPSENENEPSVLSALETGLTLAKSHLQQGRFDEAISELTPHLKRVPDHVEAIYITAVSERYAKRYDQALARVSALKLAAPDYGRAFQEEGHNYLALGKTGEALKAYQKACRLNSALEASWKAQSEILKAKGMTVEANNAAGYYQRLKALPRELHAVTNLINEDELEKAERICKRFMMSNKQNIDGIRLLADIANKMGARNESKFLYTTGIELAPRNIEIRMDYINFLKKTQDVKEAHKQAKYLDETFPGNPMLQVAHAVQCLQIGEYETAIAMFDKVLEQLPNDAGVLGSRGHALKTFGKQDEAIASYKKAIEVKPDHADTYFALANLKTYTFTDDEIALMKSVLERDDATLQDKASLSFSLGKAYEDRKDFKESFAYYDAGNESKRVQSRYDADKMSAEIQAQIGACPAELFEQKSGLGHAASDPIFILGLPRAGSTLLEQIIASHSQVDGTLELPNILTLSNRLSRRRTEDALVYPHNLSELSGEQLEEFGKAFIEDTRIHRKNAPFFIDKMPNNFRHIGLIHLILPNAKIIDARRHPMACCFSGFKQLFAEGQEFTYGLEQIGQYYRDYVNLMDHWDAVLPGKILRVQYEDVVADTEAQVRHILNYLELPFEQDCVDFHKTERSVRTASSEQVRQPIFKSGLEQWRNFEPYLDPLKEALGPILERYPI